MPQHEPQIEERERRSPKRKPGKKKFVLERRWVVKPKGSLECLGVFWHHLSEWHVFKRYHTERDRQQAIDQLRKQHDRRSWEYRFAEEGER